jgi:hypothetical protein
VWVQSPDLNDRLVKFDAAVKDIDTKEGMNKLHIMYIVQQAINTRVFYIAGGQYFWTSKKGIANLYKLGTNIRSIYNMFAQEKLTYNEGSGQENIYGDLIDELKHKGVRL